MALLASFPLVTSDKVAITASNVKQIAVIALWRHAQRVSLCLVIVLAVSQDTTAFDGSRRSHDFLQMKEKHTDSEQEQKIHPDFTLSTRQRFKQCALQWTYTAAVAKFLIHL